MNALNVCQKFDFMFKVIVAAYIVFDRESLKILNLARQKMRIVFHSKISCLQMIIFFVRCSSMSSLHVELQSC